MQRLTSSECEMVTQHKKMSYEKKTTTEIDRRATHSHDDDNEGNKEVIIC